ncbi:MAG: hypothetical protein WC261_13395, partial [Synergistaceae bacterium]
GDCKNPQYMPMITIKMVTPEPLIKLKEMFGGTFYKEKRVQACPTSFKSNKILYVWGVSNQKAIILAKAVLPFSLVKRENLLNLIALDDLKKTKGKRRNSNGDFHAQPYTDEMVSEMETLSCRSKELNA